MIAGQQIREARALVKWGQWRLAKAAEVSAKTLDRAERGEEPLTLEQSLRVEDAFSRAGVEFGSDGVKLRAIIELSAKQIHSARNLLGWDETRLSRKAGLHIETIRIAEGWRKSRRPLEAQTIAIQRALQAAGIEFTLAGGVRLAHSDAAGASGLGFQMDRSDEVHLPNTAFPLPL